MEYNVLVIIGICIWVYILYATHMSNLKFFKFIIGSSGLYLIFSFFFSTDIIYLLNVCFNKLTILWENWLGYFGITEADISVAKSGIKVLYENHYEINEIMIFVSLTIFFPIYKIPKKIKYSILGSLYIYIFNTTLSFIGAAYIILVRDYYNEIVYTVILRTLYFLLIVLLYYVTFTKEHIKKQKVGKL